MNEIERKINLSKTYKITMEEDNYPVGLKKIKNPPPVLYYRGSLPKPDKPSPER